MEAMTVQGRIVNLASRENPEAKLIPMGELKKGKEQQDIKCVESPFVQKVMHWVISGAWS